MGPDFLLAAGVGAVLFLLALTAGPVIGVGLLFAAAGVAIIFAWPILGLAAMVLTGTALQVLGSEHLTGLPISLGKAAGILTLAAWATRSVVFGIRLTYSSQLLPLLGFAAAMAVSAAAAPDRALALDGLFRYAQLFLLFFMIGSIAGERQRDLDLACLAVTACMAVASAIALAEFLLPSLSIESDDPSLMKGAIGAIIDHESLDGVAIRRITGGLSDSNWYAYTVVSFMPLNLYLLHRFRGAATRGLLVGATALQVVGVVLSLTRSALIAMAFGAIVLLARRRLPLAPMLGMVGIGAVAFVLWNPPELQRLFSAEYAQAGSTPLRELMLSGGVALIRERPMLGYGYSEYGPAFMKWLNTQQPGEMIVGWAADIQRRVDADDEALENIMPHNTVVQLWVEYGLPGIGCFFLILGGMLKDIGVARKFGTHGDALLADCLLAGLWIFAVCAMFGHLALLKVVWIQGGLAAALRRVALERVPASGAHLGGARIQVPTT